MYKDDLALDNLQGLICHKTQPNQTKPFNCVQTNELCFLKNVIYRLFICKQDLALNDMP